MTTGKKKIRIITHGERHGGFNPLHTPAGIEQISQIAKRLADETPTIPMLVCGIGGRFLQIHDALIAAGIFAEKTLYSALCGTHGGLGTGNDGSKIIELGTVIIPYDQWYWPPENVVDYWAFLDSLPDGTVICAGGELMLSLGGQAMKGRLFEADPLARTITDITDK